MIWLQSDCLLVKTAQGKAIPCSAEAVTVELVGEAAASLDPQIMQNAAQAVLHYFKSELGRDTVTVAEFASALARVLRNLGLEVLTDDEPAAGPKIAEMDLGILAAESGRGFELAFFQRLREELLDRLSESPEVVRLKGLRGCVKQLSGARRWSTRCQTLNDQIVEYLRHCWSSCPRATCVSLVVQQ